MFYFIGDENLQAYRSGAPIGMKRELSGDIKGTLVDEVFTVDQSDDWLFSYEKDDPECFARRMQALGSFKLRLI